MRRLDSFGVAIQQQQDEKRGTNETNKLDSFAVAIQQRRNEKEDVNDEKKSWTALL